MARRIIGQSPAIVLIVLLTAAMFNTLLRDYSDVSPIEVVLLDDSPPPIEETPEKPEPPAPVEKPPMLEPRVMPRIARVEKLSPKPSVRPNRPEPAPAPPLAKPRIELDAVAPLVESIPATAPRRTQRIAVDSRPPRPDAPRPDAWKSPKPKLPSEDPPPRGFRVAKASHAPRVRVPRMTPGLVPTPASPAAPAPGRPSRMRTDAPRPKAKTRSRIVSVAPALTAAPTPQPMEARRAPPQRRGRRPVPKTSARGPRPTAVMARVQAPRPMSVKENPAARVARSAQQGTPHGALHSRPGVTGVPLADLAVCMSDRDEDRLKQAVVAAVTTQKECVSRVGTYRFVETKNVNSFLMWIDRASNRSVGDRCDELRHALECLQSARPRAAR